MSSAKMTDVILVALISGVVAVLTSFMGISGTIIGAVVTSFLAELIKKYLKDPFITEMEQDNINLPRRNKNNEYKNYNQNYHVRTKRKTSDKSFITTKVLFLFPLVIILIIELIHFLGAIHIIPYDIFLNLESITNWHLFRTIGFALIIMGLYPLISKSLGTSHGIILIIVGVIELVIGYADVNAHASLIYSLFSSVKEYVNIAIILAILYTVLTVPDELEENNKQKYRSKKFNTNNNYQNRNYNNYQNYDNYSYDKSNYEDDDYYYYDE